MIMFDISPALIQIHKVTATDPLHQQFIMTDVIADVSLDIKCNIWLYILFSMYIWMCTFFFTNSVYTLNPVFLSAWTEV